MQDARRRTQDAKGLPYHSLLIAHRSLLMALLLAISYQLSAIGFAQTVADITKQVQANLEKSPWEANILGKVQLPDGSSQDADFRLQVIPGKTPAEQIARVDFKKPSALEGNFVLISDKEVWNYLFLTNQVIIQPRAKAKVEGLGVNLTSLGDFSDLTAKVVARLVGETQTADGPAWRISGTPKDTTVGYASMEILVLKSDPRPIAITLKDSSGKVVADLSIKDFKRLNVTVKTLKKYPADAEVVKK